MVEYNQCQATLKTLYDLGIPGKVEEFTAYRILNLLHGQNQSELNLFVGQLTPRQKADPAVQHALEVQRAQAMGNYHKFCNLYLTAPWMGPYIMDHFIDRERVKALMVITKAYRIISLAFLQRTLAFDTFEDTNTFLVTHSAIFTNPSSPDIDKIIECKSANQKLTQVFEEKYRKDQECDMKLGSSSAIYSFHPFSNPCRFFILKYLQTTVWLDFQDFLICMLISTKLDKSGIKKDIQTTLKYNYCIVDFVA